MSKCAIKKGFFILRDCGVSTVVTCLACGRPICPVHTHTPEKKAAPEVFTSCVECHAKQVTPHGQAAPPAVDPQDDSWSYGYRDWFYRSSHYRPIGYGRPSKFYDDYDIRSFDDESLGDAASEDEDPRGTVFDS